MILSDILWASGGIVGIMFVTCSVNKACGPENKDNHNVIATMYRLKLQNKNHIFFIVQF